ncbi:MAG: D-alanyl-D-alanine dipeptidase [Saprospiraceae bacterium]
MRLNLIQALVCLFLTAQCAQSEQKSHQTTERLADKTPESPGEAPESSGAANQDADNQAAYLNDAISDQAEAAAPAAAPRHTRRHPEGFADISVVAPEIIQEIRYASDNNFMGEKIYDCAACLLREPVAKALAQAQQRLQAVGMGIKVFDCYRPRPYQQRLWDKKPDPNYVTPPAKGSMHSRGAAVDLTLVNAEGKELDMGTPYDFFGPEAHADYLQLPQEVLRNRQILRQVMEASGFKGIRTEWWHFSYKGANFPLSDYVWPCR